MKQAHRTVAVFLLLASPPRHLSHSGARRGRRRVNINSADAAQLTSLLPRVGLL